LINNQESQFVRMSCPACQSHETQHFGLGVVSPWITELTKHDSRLTNYLSCLQCETAFFDVHYSEETLTRLYREYRGNEYFRVRNGWEPKYTTHLNEGLVGSPEWLLARRRQVIEMMESAQIPFSQIKSIIDFGGGHGGVMPEVDSRYLIDKNQLNRLEPGVKRLESLEQTVNLTFDLVMCCGVLEHVNEPLKLLQQVRSINSKWFLFEVPKGIPTKRIGVSNNKTFLQQISLRRPLWRLIRNIEDGTPYISRRFFPLRCSEHIQFFTEKGLGALLENSGFKVLLMSSSKPNKGLADREGLAFLEGLMVVCRKT